MEELRKYLRDLPPTGRNDYSALFGDGIKYVILFHVPVFDFFFLF